MRLLVTFTKRFFSDIKLPFPRKVRFWEAFEKVFLLEIVKHILGFWVKLLFSWKVVPFLYVRALGSLISGRHAFAEKLSL